MMCIVDRDAKEAHTAGEKVVPNFLKAWVTSGAEVVRVPGAVEDLEVFQILCGGEVDDDQTVTEEYLLDLERVTFLELCHEEKTLERIEHILKTGKPLRN